MDTAQYEHATVEASVDNLLDRDNRKVKTRIKLEQLRERSALMKQILDVWDDPADSGPSSQ
jgi:hypothetical protein